MISVLTLVHGRETHLANLVAGLERSEVKPDELVIVHMNEPARPRHSPHFPIIAREIRDADFLPLAVARNDAASAARGGHLIFLDVDCIPGARLVGEYENAIRRQPDALHQGEVRYLPASMKGIEGALAAAGDLDEKVPRHPLHPHRIAGTPIPYDLFWSLNFACRKTVFDRIGGFDPRYRGYGAEDTDFSYRARSESVALFSAPALAFHQYHPTYDPPLNHLSSIVENARTFKRRWGKWPMGGWLDAFAQRGFIALHDDRIDVRRLPTREDIEGCLEKTFAVDAG